jgi:hypothetical protein
MKKVLILSLLLLAALCWAQEDKLSEDVYLLKPVAELKQLHETNLTKGRELYDLKKYKESLPYLDKAIFFSNVMIKQARLRKQAQDALDEAKRWVNDAGKVVKPNR